METLALLYANFERICAEKKEVEEQFDQVAETYARIEDDLNEGLRATATLALTCGKNDPGHDEVLYLQETMDMVDSLLAMDTHDDGFEVVVIERPVAQ